MMALRHDSFGVFGSQWPVKQSTFFPLQGDDNVQGEAQAPPEALFAEFFNAFQLLHLASAIC